MAIPAFSAGCDPNKTMPSANQADQFHMHVTKFQLIQALLSGGPLKTPSADFTSIVAIEREDGSGHCYNVTGCVRYGSKTTVFVRTID